MNDSKKPGIKIDKKNPTTENLDIGLEDLEELDIDDTWKIASDCSSDTGPGPSPGK